MNDIKPIYKGLWQYGSTIKQELKGPIGDGQVTYPNGDRFNGYFHLSYASINGPAYAAEGRYTCNSYNNYIYEPYTDVTVYFHNGDSIDHWGGGLKLLKPYDGYLTLHCAETQMSREERWEQGTCVEAEEWKRDTRTAKKLSLPQPFGKGETDALVWRDGHIKYNFGEWTYDGETR